MIAGKEVDRSRLVGHILYDFLIESDFDHGDEVSFYYQCNEKIWEMVIRRQKDWGDSDTD